MTCQSCVKNIEGVTGAKPGVISIKVSLELKEAHIQFNPQITSPDVLREQIDDMGFEASLPPTSEAEEFDKIAKRAMNGSGVLDKGNNTKSQHKTSVVSLNIEGMTCQSCVQNIEGVISEKEGVNSIKVSLENKNAVIEYTPTLISPEKLRDQIDDMGFEAALRNNLAKQGSSVDRLLAGRVAEPKIAVAHVNIEGVTCQSCVKNIEGVMSEKQGVNTIKVSLENKNAVIQYNPVLTNPETLRDQIDDMGFEASLPEKRNDSLSDFDPLKSVPDSPDIPEAACVISVEGMTCQSCVKAIEGKMSEVPGIVAIKVSLSDKKAEVKFKPSTLTPQDIADLIDDMGFETAVLVGAGKNQKKASISVKGMTCNSCVQNIEGVIGDRADVVSIKVLTLFGTVMFIAGQNSFCKNER